MDACPVLVRTLRNLDEGMPEDLRSQTRFVLVTVDPQRDTPVELRRYRSEMQLEKARWTLLRGSQDDVRELAAVLGVSYDQLGTGQFVHSNLVTVLDQRGEIIHQQSGTDDLLEIVRVLRRTVESSSG